MRYNTKIYFIDKGEPTYDFDTSRWVESEEVTKAYASVTDLGTTRSVQLFGDVVENAKVARLMNAYKEPFEFVEIDSVRYGVLKNLVLDPKQTLVLKEANHG